MSILERYIAGTLIKGWFTVLLVLGTVFGLIALIQELDKTQGDYGVPQVIYFTLLSLPQQLLDLMPVIALLGTIVAIANLDKANELTIIRSAGVHLATVLKAIILPTLVLMALLWVCLEYVSGPAFQTAQLMKSATRNDHPDRIPNGGVWSKFDNRYIHLSKLRDGKEPGDIRLYQFDDSGELVQAVSAVTAQIEQRRWNFNTTRTKTNQNGEMVTALKKSLAIDNLWSVKELPTLSLPSQSMRLSVLYEYAQYLREQGQPYEIYLLAFWQRITLPFAVAAMILLATPVSTSLGSGRDAGLGKNIAIGAVIGIFFFLGTQISHAVGQLMGLNFLLITLAPIAVIAVVALLLLARLRW
ncbi:LPS export ABC transporter permease LptG [Halieaceae bacterium IMCC14734]|uniref:LPS export ABC transporter permease LptG n=1 Tax=Candidatus Litorirhabdus singularis TaxID=2518993 RepID=A0ABT3TKY7_9GAMM|nr:LPS export ABC transporter permease LptG [Candidatus Litorirhabdus singularis]MCX2982430.1 LPS export ABC transporter permease LptG [Candidatus Litorirhabdus singularis]